MASILIKNGKVVSESEIKIQDILIKNDKIDRIAENIKDPFADKIDASGKIVIPGGVDVHTHLNLHAGLYTAEDDFYTGTVAAACGGTTTIVDHMGFGPRNCSLMHQVNKYHEFADGKAVIDYSFHGVFQHINKSILNEIQTLVNEGITSFKAYLVYDYALGDNEILQIMEKIKQANALLAVHCENKAISDFMKNKFLSEGKTAPIYHALSRSDICEAEAVNRMICLSKTADNAPLYLVHISSAKSIEHLMMAHKEKNCIIAETCPQYLFLDIEHYKGENGLKYILTPPLREKFSQNVLWEGIINGNISTIGTDHCPFSFKLKNKVALNDFSKCPNGLPGIETRIPLMFSEGVMKKRIPLRKFVDINCANPAKIMGLYPEKGVIKKGSDADIVIIDPEKRTKIKNEKLHQNVDYTPFEDFELTGYPILTISKGKIIVKDNIFIGKKGAGKFLKRKLFHAS